ncbi:MAG: tripartite tricarboxylate transporter TctB family protein [Duodenibacillus sp.]|nr:tripartite tricarboxylate transporter TctB family protein [Duodenibacillus sp.]
MGIRNSKDFWSGILFAACGLFFIVFAQEHPMGSAARMGPAYFPTLLGGLLAVLGSIIALIGYFRKPPQGESGDVEPFQWKLLGLILGSVVVFSFILEFLGLMISTAVMIGIAALADRTSRLKETIAMIVILDAIVYIAFVYGIGMLVPVWPTLFAGA